MDTREDLFVVPAENEHHIIYAPLRGVAFFANTPAIRYIQQILVDGQSAIPTTPDEENVFLTMQREHLLESVQPELVPRVSGDHAYNGIVLSLTSNCNLRCVYCYARAGDIVRTMDWSVARAALNLLPEISKRNDDKARLHFTGGGETTMVSRLMQRCVEYATTVVSQAGGQLALSLTTNVTLLTSELVEWMNKHQFRATVSIDGPAKIQDLQRPKADGSGSFSRVMAGLDLLRKYEIPFSIRATVTPAGVGNLSDIVAFLASQTAGEKREIHVEAVEQIGRAAHLPNSTIAPEQFVEAYKAAWQVAEENHVTLSTSGDRVFRRKSPVFCGASGTTFSVVPEGYVSSCTRITQLSDPTSSTFFFGKYNAQLDRFDIDDHAYQRLRSIHVENQPECSHCFCKWHCAGHCPESRAVGESPFLCEITRLISKWRLTELLARESCLTMERESPEEVC